MSIEQFKPGWLRDAIHRATVSIRARYDRRVAVENYGHSDPYPLGWDDAEELAAYLSKRFESWTGRTLEQHFAARPR